MIILDDEVLLIIVNIQKIVKTLINIKKNFMLNKFRYNNKIRYNLRKQSNVLLLWEKEKNNIFKTQFLMKKLKKKNWQGNIFWKHNDINNIMYKSATKYYREVTNNFWKEKRSYNDWAYHPAYVYRKRPFLTRITNRKNFIDNILLCIKKKDSLYFIRNSLYYLFDENLRINKIYDVLNFAWLYIYKDSNKNIDSLEQLNLLALNSFYRGFLKKGNKRKCEIKFIELLSLLKLKLKKASLHIMYFFIRHLKPLIGFRRQRIGRYKTQKRKDFRYSFKIYGHNLRWQSLLFKRICFNSPYYQKKTQNVSVNDLYKSLILSINSKGPIAKCLGMYYTLIGRSTPYVERKKKKKGKSKSVRIKR
jgi:hypothetical protein